MPWAATKIAATKATTPRTTSSLSHRALRLITTTPFPIGHVRVFTSGTLTVEGAVPTITVPPFGRLIGSGQRACPPAGIVAAAWLA